MKTIAPEALQMADYVRADSRVVVGHSTAEPATLLEALVAGRATYAGAKLFIHASFSTIVAPEHSDCLHMQSLGGVGTQARLTKAGVLEIIPAHLSQVPQFMQNGLLDVDVLLVSVSPPDAQGRYSFGLVGDYLMTAAQQARVVIAEMNARMPFTHGGPYLSAEDIDVLVPTDRPLYEVAPSALSEVERAIAKNVAGFVDDGAVIQLGVGAIPDAVAASLHHCRDLGVHTGVLPNAVQALIEKGVVTNARKSIDRGISVAGAIWGTQSLYDFVHDNPAVHIRPSTYTHAPSTFAALDQFVSLNSGIEIDLVGQANMEVAGGRYIGAVGGALDFVRGAQMGNKGHSIIALPATAAGGKVSRISAQLNGPVTIGRSDIDKVITEFGVAELKGQSLKERARRLIAIAHPDFREDLERAGALINF